MLLWATNIIETGGYLGVVLAMVAENIFPPIPSELIMLFAGAAAAQGELNLILIVLFAAVGSTLGLLPWYVAGKWYGKERLKAFANRHGRLLTFSGRDVERADAWFALHGKTAVLVGRFLPAIRTLIAIPAAIMRMRFSTFLLFAFLGSLIWDGIFASAGYVVGENRDSLTAIIDIGTYTAFAVVVVWYVYRVARFKTSP